MKMHINVIFVLKHIQETEPKTTTSEPSIREYNTIGNVIYVINVLLTCQDTLGRTTLKRHKNVIFVMQHLQETETKIVT